MDEIVMPREKVGLLFALLFVALSAKANPTVWRPESGRVQLSASQSNISIFGADTMLPLFGNNHQFVYGDFMGSYGTDNTSLVSPGLGYRTVVNNQILGGYIFDDYERTSLSEDFWVLSPGMEWISAAWDARVNGYFPIQSRQQNGTTDWADNYGVYQYGDPHGNSFDNAYLTPYAVIGNGIDTEVGYSFDQGDHLRSRIFLGGYYYHPQQAYDVDNITGATAGFTKAVTKNVTVSLLNSYDNINRYTLGISLTATLGSDSNEYSSNVEDRMLDPVERHVGIIDTGAGTYDQQSYQVTGFGTEYDNVEYTSPHGTGVGTYEDPASLTQENLEAFNEQFPEGARVFVQGGVDAKYKPSSNLTLHNNQSIYGRTASYKAPADSDGQPEIVVGTGNDGFIIESSKNSISDITLTGTSNTAGILIHDDSTVTLSNVNVSGFNYGVRAENFNNEDTLTLNITGSTFNNNGNGILAANNSNGEMIINVTDSTANNNDNNGLSVTNNNMDRGTTGITTLNISHSEFNNNDNAGIYIANGVDGTLTVNVDYSAMNDNSQVGMEFENDANSEGTGAGILRADISNSTFDNNGDPNSGPGMEIISSGDGTMIVAITDSLISNSSEFGIYVANNSSSSNSVINISDLSGTTFSNNGLYGIYGTAVAGSSTTIDYTDAIFAGNTSTNKSSDDNIDWIPSDT